LGRRRQSAAETLCGRLSHSRARLARAARPSRQAQNYDFPAGRLAARALLRACTGGVLSRLVSSASLANGPPKVVPSATVVGRVHAAKGKGPPGLHCGPCGRTLGLAARRRRRRRPDERLSTLASLCLSLSLGRVSVANLAPLAHTQQGHANEQEQTHALILD